MGLDIAGVSRVGARQHGEQGIGQNAGNVRKQETRRCGGAYNFVCVSVSVCVFVFIYCKFLQKIKLKKKIIS